MLHGHYDRVTCCAVFDDNSRIVSGSAGGALRVWHLILEEETGPSTGTLMGQQQEQGETNNSCGAGHTGAITALVTIERTPEKQMRGGRGPAADLTAPPPPPSRERAKLRVRFHIIRSART